MTDDQDSLKRRTRGEGRVYRRGRIWWIQYNRNGRRAFESSRSNCKPVAERLLRQRLGEVAAGIAPPLGAGRITYENLRNALLVDYATNRRKWLTKEGQLHQIIPLDAHFQSWRASAITTDEVRAYVQRRQQEGAANGTINRELALLRRMFRLAVEDGKLRDVAPTSPC